MVRQLYHRLAELLSLRPPRGSSPRHATPIAQARDRRLMRLCGRAQPDGDARQPLLTSPLGKRSCLYYRVQIQAYRDGRWQTVIDKAKLAKTFLLQDSTGMALVEGCNKRTVVSDAIWTQASDFDGHPTPRVAALLHQRRHYQARSPRRYRHREVCIEAGQELWVVGLCRHELDPDPRSASTYRHRSLRVRLLAPWFGVLRIGVEDRSERLGASGKLC